MGVILYSPELDEILFLGGVSYDGGSPREFDWKCSQDMVALSALDADESLRQYEWIFVGYL